MPTLKNMDDAAAMLRSRADANWFPTKAKTLTGAKIVACLTYQSAAGGKIEVAELVGSGESERYERVAVKYGFDAWQQA